jgi:diguanylate cyclase (GGDEF)-like protein
MTPMTGQVPTTPALFEEAARSPDTARRCLMLGASIAAIILVSILDHLSGVQIRIFPLYYLPIAFGTHFVSSRAGLFLGALSAVGWLLSNWLYGEDTLGPGIWAINTGVMILSFATIAVLIGKLGRAFATQRELARRDQLTDLPNGRAFYEHAELLMAGARRSLQPFTIAYFDLDNFKAVNDERGHHEGDLVLGEVGKILKQQLRSSDVVARIGGDEFIAMLPSTGAPDARTVLERTRTTLAEEMAGRGWPVTMSIGAVSFREAPATLEEAVRIADDLMYEVKNSGKNSVQVKAIDGEGPAGDTPLHPRISRAVESAFG